MKAPVTVSEFYSGKNIFITGGSGFLGICLLEKILRTIPNHGDIYLLLRPKRGKTIDERLEEIKRNDIFEVLLREKSVEQVFAKVKTVAGDVGEDNLGLSESDRRLLTENIHVIFHSAATLDFGDTLKMTVNINLLGTRRVIQLARECTHLTVLVHVSSAYVNSWATSADETIYSTKRDPNDLIALVNKLTPEELEEQTPEILGSHPNTYTITKHMAELEIKNVAEEFPCVIVRPSMIIGAWKEPVPGWTISKNGPQGFFMGAANGVVRRLPVGTRLVYDYIPVDVVVNNLITGGLYGGKQQPKTVSVYHCTSSTRNPFRWCTIEDKINVYLHRYPLRGPLWYPYLKLLPSVTWYKISAFFVHFLPALLIDGILSLTGGRPRLVKLHRNINSSLNRLEKFIFTEWRFTARKTMDLQDWLSETDKEDYNLDISSLVWEDYFSDLTLGSRIYLNKDPIRTLAAAKRKDTLLKITHISVQICLHLLVWYCFFRITGWTAFESSIILPIFFVLFNLL